jgi:hypothetical protein
VNFDDAKLMADLTRGLASDVNEMRIAVRDYQPCLLDL